MGQVHGLDVMIYFWDDRDGPNFCGWWFGPKVGGDQVWAYHPDKSAPVPPSNGWKVPYDGPEDTTMKIDEKRRAAPSKPKDDKKRREEEEKKRQEEKKRVEEAKKKTEEDAKK